MQGHASRAEAVPPGQAAIRHLEPFTATKTTGLAHSGLYQSKPVIDQIVQIIREPTPNEKLAQPPGSRKARRRDGPAGEAVTPLQRP
jgi:hypothetical protein